MSNLELIKELRALTQAGMKDCKESLIEANWDIQKAIDIVKSKGLNIVSGREGKVAADGLIIILENCNGSAKVLLECNSQTDFVSNSPEFKQFTQLVAEEILHSFELNEVFNVSSVEEDRQNLVATTKENIVVRRWWVEESINPCAKVFSYLHSNSKIGVLLTLLADSPEAAASKEFSQLGEDLAMQVAAMNPLSVSVDTLDMTVVARQRAIFELQLTELKKPQAAWPKILDGKFNKFFSESCLLNQESVLQSKTTIQKVVENVSKSLKSEIKIVNFIRALVGDGIEVTKTNLQEEVAKLM